MLLPPFSSLSVLFLSFSCHAEFVGRFKNIDRQKSSQKHPQCNNRELSGASVDPQVWICQDKDGSEKSGSADGRVYKMD